MIPRRLIPLLGVGLALLCLAAPAWAHPGHDDRVPVDHFRPDTAPDSRHTTDPWGALGRQAPAAATLIVVALALLAAGPQRRRTIPLVLALLLAMVSLEGLLHAAMHLHHVRHADGLAIGASPAQPTATDRDAEAPDSAPVIRLSLVVEPYDAPVPDIVLSAGRGRAPPLSPA